MNSIIKSSVRVCLRGLINPSRSIAVSTSKSLSRTPAYTRTFWHMCSSHSMRDKNENGIKLTPVTELCSCGCMGVHTNGEKELIDFLKEEIVAEKSAFKKKSIPSEIDGYLVNTNGSEVILKKDGPGESVTINFNVNHTVDTDEPQGNQTSGQAEEGEMKSKPSFEIDIVRNGKTLSFTCSFTDPTSEPSEDGYNDVFGIDEVTYFEGEFNDKTYAVDGEVLDGYLYDLLMTLLEEKGVSNEFAQKLADLATGHEHKSYIGLLENLNSFIIGK